MVFPIIQSIHIAGLILLVGTIAIADLSILGFIRVSANLSPWTSTGLVTMGITGPLLFWLDWHRYLNNPAFLVKIAILTIALVTHFTLDRSKHRKLAAVLSLILWSCVVLAGRAIADFDIRITGKLQRHSPPFQGGVGVVNKDAKQPYRCSRSAPL